MDCIEEECRTSGHNYSILDIGVIISFLNMYVKLDDQTPCSFVSLAWT